MIILYIIFSYVAVDTNINHFVRSRDPRFTRAYVSLLPFYQKKNQYHNGELWTLSFICLNFCLFFFIIVANGRLHHQNCPKRVADHTPHMSSGHFTHHGNTKQYYLRIIMWSSARSRYFSTRATPNFYQDISC